MTPPTDPKELFQPGTNPRPAEQDFLFEDVKGATFWIPRRIICTASTYRLFPFDPAASIALREELSKLGLSPKEADFYDFMKTLPGSAELQRAMLHAIEHLESRPDLTLVDKLEIASARRAGGFPANPEMGIILEREPRKTKVLKRRPKPKS